EFPLMLLTGRGSSSQWHTQTRTAKSAVLRSLGAEEPYVEISPDDAAARALTTGDWTVITSARGSMHARARVTPIVAPGQVFVPMHYAQTNCLTSPSFDPYSRQPSYKSGAVQVQRARGQHR
ncbi:MAG TPA: molybdopterin dinucleotide binding domain-containing protein, partial [Acidimicrobiia bacterium]